MTTTTTAVPGSTHRLGYYGALLVPLAYCLVLISSLTVQFTGELPCELCLMQRWSMLLVCTGPVFIARRAWSGDVTLADFTRGYGISVIAAVIGGLISLHQLTLTNLPGHHGFGPAVLGLHTYTWALVTFTIVVLFAAVNMIWADRLVPVGVHRGIIPKVIIGLYLLITVLITVLTFLQGGFHMDFHTTRYELFYDLGIR